MKKIKSGHINFFQKFGVCKILLNIFLKVSYAHQGCIYLIKIQ